MGLSGLCHGFDIRLAVADSRQQRGHHHPRRDAVLHQVLHCLQPGHRPGRAGLSELPDVIIDAANAEVDVHLGNIPELFQDIDVPPHQDSLGGDRARVLKVA